MSNSLRVVAIVQARVGSSRLPAKTLETLYDKSLLAHIVERLQSARSLTDTVIATTEQKADDKIADLAQRLGTGLHRGSETDVLNRFHGAALERRANLIVRVTADDPFKDPEIIDRAVKILLEGDYDYCSNTLIPTFPEGLDIEVVRFSALDRAFCDAKLQSEREHVTPYIWKHPELFKLHNFTHNTNLSHLRWTIDYPQDLKFAREIYGRLYPRKHVFLLKDILELLSAHPELSTLNQGVERNEGYLKSLREEAEK